MQYLGLFWLLMESLRGGETHPQTSFVRWVGVGGGVLFLESHLAYLFSLKIVFFRKKDKKKKKNKTRPSSENKLKTKKTIWLPRNKIMDNEWILFLCDDCSFWKASFLNCGEMSICSHVGLPCTYCMLCSYWSSCVWTFETSSIIDSCTHTFLPWNNPAETIDHWNVSLCSDLFNIKDIRK